MSVFSGVIPLVTITKNNQANAFVGGLLNNLLTSGVSVALSQSVGAQVYNALGLSPQGSSNFLGSILTPGLISTGVGALSQAITNSVVNSKALGPAGTLGSNLLNVGVSSLGGELTRVISNLGTNGSVANKVNYGSQFFPGAGGQGEGDANYEGNLYTLGSGGPDVVFSITSALTTAADQATTGAGGSSPGAPGSAGGLAKVSESPAGTPNPGATPPPAGTASAATMENVVKPKDSSRGKSAGWKFICPPEDISWQTSAQADRVAIFGANQSPVIAGVRGMRELSMSGAIVEGFTRGKTIEDKVIALEKLLDMKLSADKRYLQVPVYKVTANSKVYGLGLDEGGYFVIKDIKVQEKMRDLGGKATRALVDITFMQVPKYQVESGRDIASQTVAGAKGPFEQLRQSVEEQARQGAQAAQTAQGATGAAGARGGTPGARR